MAGTIPANLLGLIVSGDLSGITIYTDRYGRKIAFPQAPPTSPPTSIQAWQRGRMREAMANWANSPPSTKRAYRQVPLKLSLVINGTSLWFCLSIRPDDKLRATLERQSGITLPPPPHVG